MFGDEQLEQSAGTFLAPPLEPDELWGQSKSVGPASVLAPVPDFRYVGLEPVHGGEALLPSTVFGIVAGTVLTLHGSEPWRAAATAASIGLLSAAFLKTTRRGERSKHARGARMGIVPWGVLVEAEDGPRVLRWAALRSIDVRVSKAPRILTKGWPSSRVVVETDREQYVGRAVGTVPLALLVDHLTDYAVEQASPLALGLDGNAEGPVLEATEPSIEPLLATARAWLASAEGIGALSLPSLDYRSGAARAPSPSAIEVLRRVLRDRTPKAADPRAFAAVLAAEIGAFELTSELCSLTLCPHPLVAAVAKQAARKLRVPRPKVGLLDENAPFLFDSDRERLEAWLWNTV